MSECAVCNEPITDTSDPDLCCWGHEENCPRFTDPDAETLCDCEVYWHPDCCPVCNGPEKSEEE